MKVCEVQIDRNVPAPPARKAGKWLQVFNAMNIGDSFVASNSDCASAATAFVGWKNKNDGRKDLRFSRRRVDESTMRCWMLESRS